jgi:phage shock protein A
LFPDIAPFLWPFVLLSLGVALTPVSPISWSYSTWLLFIIPLIITVFAPIRTFSGPLRFAYLEYASKITSWAVSLLKAVVLNFHSIPTLALPALFFLPVLPVLFFVFFPAIPIVWHFIAYHYRRRLKAVTTSVAHTNASLDLAISRARQAVALAHTYEKQALYTFSETRCIPLVAVARHSTDFGTPTLSDSEGHWRLIQTPGTLGADLAGKVLDTEKQMTLIEDASQRVRALSEQAVVVATEGDMVAGEELAENAAHAMQNVVNQVDELRSVADQARCTWVDLRQRLHKVTTSASTTTARLDLMVAQAERATTLAHSYEKQALAFVSTTRRTASHTLALHDADFFETSDPVQQARGAISAEAERVRALGNSLSYKVALVKTKIIAIEYESSNIRILLEQAVTATVDGNVEAGESWTAIAEENLRGVIGSVQELSSTSDEIRQAWVELSVEYWAIP